MLLLKYFKKSNSNLKNFSSIAENKFSESLFYGLKIFICCDFSIAWALKNRLQKIISINFFEKKLIQIL